MTRTYWQELLGWLGSIAILAAYFLNAMEFVAAQSLVYLLLNLLGAIGLGWVCWVKKTYQAFFLEIVWALIAIWGIVAYFF